MPESALTPRRNCWLVRLSEASVIGESPVTITRNVVLLLRGGEPSSVTHTVTVFVLSACAAVGCQVKRPLDASMAAPTGAPVPRLMVRMFGGMSGSYVMFVTIKREPGRMVRSGTGMSSGGLFTSLTTTVKLLVSLKGVEPSSVTRTVMRLVLGPWASVGVQVNTPVLGWRFTPVGAATKLKLRALARMFVSVAVFVTTSVVSSLMD